jgi:2,5-diketo-D-gluconate reductase A
MSDTRTARPPTVMLASGAPMPVLGLGTWQLDHERAYRSVRAALDSGYRLIDTATMYGNEADIGRAIRDSAVPRRELFVTTKLPPERAGREEETITASLRALGLDRIDLWLVHWPPSDRMLVRTWERFLALRDAGLALAVGVSNHSMGQIDRLTEATGEAPAVHQVPWAPALFNPQLLVASRERGIVLEGYSPFKRTNLRHRTLVAIAQHHGKTPAQVVLRWHVQRDVIAIPKSATPSRIAENVEVFDFSLTPEEMQAIDQLR